MRPTSDEKLEKCQKLDKCLKNLAGTVVFTAVLYFCFRNFFEATITTSLIFAIPGGFIGLFIFIKSPKKTCHRRRHRRA